MNDKDKELYQISWTQEYPNWGVSVDELDELMLEYSEYKEANTVINMIKAKR
jgi:hypothetical protein